MEIKCPLCGEPWDLLSILEGEGTRPRVPNGWHKLEDFTRHGCRAIDRALVCQPSPRAGTVDRLTAYNEVMATLYRDLDGAAAELAELGPTLWPQRRYVPDYRDPDGNVFEGSWELPITETNGGTR